MATFESLGQMQASRAGAGPKAQRLGRNVGAKAMDFGGMLDAVSAMGPTVGAAGQVSGMGTSTQAVLAAAFSGINGMQQVAGGSAYGGGMGGGMQQASMGDLTGGIPSIGAGTYKASTTGTSLGGLSDPNSSVVPGTEGFSQMDMINTMNSNNLGLLELQAVMQSNMQAWNTKSNILSADHRARMAMIEKFTARG